MGVGVAVGLDVGVLVGVLVGVDVGVDVGVEVGVGVLVGVLVGVEVGVLVGVKVGVGVEVTSGSTRKVKVQRDPSPTAASEGSGAVVVSGRESFQAKKITPPPRRSVPKLIKITTNCFFAITTSIRLTREQEPCYAPQTHWQKKYWVNPPANYKRQPAY